MAWIERCVCLCLLLIPCLKQTRAPPTTQPPNQPTNQPTPQTGNFKRFSTFARMLVTALNTGSDSVFVDLLTYQDLEALRARKLGQKVRARIVVVVVVMLDGWKE